MSALGSCVWYMQHLRLDKETMELGLFRQYSPSAALQLQVRGSLDAGGSGEALVLDCETLANLDILVNSDGTQQGTLFAHVDHTLTPFGRRRLREWVAKFVRLPQLSVAVSLQRWRTGV